MSLTVSSADIRPVVVLLHSSMSSASQWSRLLAQEGAHFRFVAPDLLGYGRAPFPLDPEGFSLGHEVDAVMASLAAHVDAHEPLHLVGHSYGGATALRLARELGARVRSLCVFEPVAFNLLRGDALLDGVEDLVSAMHAAETDADAARLFIDYWNRSGTFASLAPQQQARFASQVAKARLDFAALLGEPSTLADCARLRLPTLVLHGQATPQPTLRIARLLAQAVPGARLHATAGGHMAPLTHADEVNAAIGAFLHLHVREQADASAATEVS